jgi:two-component system, OmpR family, sensor kinase
VSRLVPQGLRGRLVAAILIVAVAVLTGSFFALHQGTGSDLRARVDDQLAADLAEFRADPAGRASTPSQLERAARDFIRGQGYHSESRILVVQSGDGAIITNEPELIHELSENETGEAGGDGDDQATALLGAIPGLSTVDAPDGGRLRVLTEPLTEHGRTIGTFRAAESLTAVDAAQSSLRDTLLLVGAIALTVLVAAALWIATRVARPLTEIADFAAELDSADLDRRLAIDRGPTEVRSLASSFNRMLERMQRAFRREREFVADASHELRTPVTIARGELDLLRRDVDPSAGERVDKVRRELQRMERLVSEMLTLASQETEGPLRRKPVDVADLLSDLRRDLPLMGPRNYLVADAAGSVQADPDRLAQVFRNLLQNAVAHTVAQGNIRVDVETAGDRIRFVVTDDGPGFAREEAQRLFDRFYRTDAGRSREQGGTGLGLAIARSIVEAHGGRIWAEANGAIEGATVAFELPGYRP